MMSQYTKMNLNLTIAFNDKVSYTCKWLFNITPSSSSFEFIRRYGSIIRSHAVIFMAPQNKIFLSMSHRDSNFTMIRLQINFIPVSLSAWSVDSTPANWSNLITRYNYLLRTWLYNHSFVQGVPEQRRISFDRPLTMGEMLSWC
jgi:hypothetical protein